MPRVLLGRADPRDAEIKAAVAAGIARQGLSQSKLADMTGMTQGTLSRRLKYPREMRVGELRDIADALDIPAEELIKGFDRGKKK